MEWIIKHIHVKHWNVITHSSFNFYGGLDKQPLNWRMDEWPYSEQNNWYNFLCIS